MSGVKEERFISLLLKLDLEFLELSPKTLINSLQATSRDFDTLSYLTLTLKKAEVIRENLTVSTWHKLETKGKFDKNTKLSFISDDMLILGCDVGSEIHYLRAIDIRGRELSKSACSFNNASEGFWRAKEWAVELAAKNDKKQIVLGLEPTGQYWFYLATWMIANGISVVQMNPYAVK